ncbi:MAG: Sir2 family NAD-dependent protein deacetylase [Dehalococcoidia bacterium]|nr:Sir2 family NAD-dependent protein deacetylase [Dehalococcoidia bacterium]
MPSENLDQLIQKAADLIVKSKRIVVFTGAGISTESGIPDFRSPGGIWTKYDPDEFTYQAFVSSHDIRKKHWQFFESSKLASPAQPNAAHYALSEMEKMGKLDCIITQNVDELHQKAGNSPEIVFQLHGNMSRVKCLGCGKMLPMDEVQARVKRGEDVPYCQGCGGILKPDGVFFGEQLPAVVLSEASIRSRKCDLCIVIGSSLVVYPAAFMPQYALQSGAKLVIVNRDSTDLDGRADVCIHAGAGETMTRLVDKVKKQSDFT